MRFLPLPVALLALSAVPLAARTVEDGQGWVNVNAQGSLKGRLLYYGELQPRFFDGGSRIGQILTRGAIGWRLSDAVSVFQGYGHIAEPNDALPRDRNEERSYQQLSWNLGNVAGGRLSSRTRFEQRWRSDGSDVGLRLRHLVRYSHPIRRDPDGVALLVSFEPFVAFNKTDWGARAGFDQLRSNVALDIPLTGKTRIELGYLNQLINQRGGDHQVNHIAQVILQLRP